MSSENVNPVEPENTQNESNEQQPESNIEQPKPEEITVEQPKPEEIGEQPKPEETVEQPKPEEITVEQPKLEETVEQPKPEEIIEQPEQNRKESRRVSLSVDEEKQENVLEDTQNLNETSSVLAEDVENEEKTSLNLSIGETKEEIRQKSNATVAESVLEELLQQKSAETLEADDIFARDEEDASENQSILGRHRTTSKNVTIDENLAVPPDLIKDEAGSILISVGEDGQLIEGWEETTQADDTEHIEEESKFEETIDRNMYYELYTLFNQQHKEEKIKNNFLQTRLAAYYTKRKMTYVLREPFFHVDELQKKYEKELENLESLIEESDRIKQMSHDEYYHLKIKRDMKDAELKLLFEKLQSQEAEYGKGLTFEKTGRHNMDKIVERFLKRQKTQTTLTMKLRSEYINLQNRMNEKTRALEDLDHLGPGFRIMDFVQLKSDNRGLHDKLEEKEAELAVLRKSCQNRMQILAHNREKSAVLDLDIQNLKEDGETISQEYEDARSNLHYMMRERDEFRTQVKNLKLEYSLFLNRKLLRDMERSVDDLGNLKDQLEAVQQEYAEAENHTKMVRKNLRYYLHNKNREKEADNYAEEDDDFAEVNKM